MPQGDRHRERCYEAGGEYPADEQLGALHAPWDCDRLFCSRARDPPMGVGSLELQTPLATDKVVLFNYDHISNTFEQHKRYRLFDVPRSNVYDHKSFSGPFDQH